MTRFANIPLRSSPTDRRLSAARQTRSATQSASRMCSLAICRSLLLARIPSMRRSMLEYELAFLIMSALLVPLPFRLPGPCRTFICTVTSLGFGRDKHSEAFHRFIVEYAHFAGKAYPVGGRSGRAAVFVRTLERAGELDQARDVVHRQELIHVRQHRAHTRRPRLESLVTQARIQPDELPARLVQALHLLRQPFADVSVQAVGDHQHDRVLSEHSARPSQVELPQAVADARSAGPVGDRVR